MNTWKHPQSLYYLQVPQRKYGKPFISRVCTHQNNDNKWNNTPLWHLNKILFKLSQQKINTHHYSTLSFVEFRHGKIYSSKEYCDIKGMKRKKSYNCNEQDCEIPWVLNDMRSGLLVCWPFIPVFRGIHCPTQCCVVWKHWYGFFLSCLHQG